MYKAFTIRKDINVTIVKETFILNMSREFTIKLNMKAKDFHVTGVTKHLLSRITYSNTKLMFMKTRKDTNVNFVENR